MPGGTVWRAEKSVWQLEFDGDDDLGFHRLAIEHGGLIAPEGDRVHGDLRECGVAAHPGESTRRAVGSDDGANADSPLQVALTGESGITWFHTLEERSAARNRRANSIRRRRRAG